VWAIAAEMKIQLRDDFAIENYVNDPDSTPEDKLVTEILIPTA
jgi:effector-binding domain-containing protein